MKYPQITMSIHIFSGQHDDVIKWKHFPRYWPFVRGIHRSPVNSPHKGQWRGALMFSLACARINGWVNNREAGDLRLNRAHYDVIVMRLRKHHILWRWNTILHLFSHYRTLWAEKFYQQIRAWIANYICGVMGWDVILIHAVTLTAVQLNHCWS